MTHVVQIWRLNTLSENHTIVLQCITFAFVQINIDTAKEYLTAHSIYNSATGPLPVAAHAVTPSTLYIELCIQTGVDGSEAMDSTGVSVVSETVLSLNVAFASLGPLPVHLSLVKNHEPHPLQQQLFGSNKGFAWYFSGS